MGDSQSEDEEPFSLRSYVQVGKVTAQREFTFVCSVRFRTFSKNTSSDFLYISWKFLWNWWVIELPLDFMLWSEKFMILNDKHSIEWNALKTRVADQFHGDTRIRELYYCILIPILHLAKVAYKKGLGYFVKLSKLPNFSFKSKTLKILLCPLVISILP